LLPEEKIMNKKIISVLALLTASFQASAGMEDDPLLTFVKIDQFEIRNTDGPDPLVFDGQLWIGKDLNKLWIKSEIERVDGETEENELQLLYSRAIAPYWDFQVGWRKDFKPDPDQDWLAIGVQGLAPYFFEVEATAFISDESQTNLRLEAEYELLFTQRLILSPEVEVNLYTDDDAERGVGSGFSDLELGLRLRYEIRREFAPYIGVNWMKKFGNTADFAEADGQEIEDTQFVAGIRAWY